MPLNDPLSESFSSGNNWLRGFLRRQSLSRRRVTTHGRDPVAIKEPLIAGMHLRLLSMIASRRHDVLVNLDESGHPFQESGQATYAPIGAKVIRSRMRAGDEKRAVTYIGALATEASGRVFAINGAVVLPGPQLEEEDGNLVLPSASRKPTRDEFARYQTDPKFSNVAVFRSPNGWNNAAGMCDDSKSMHFNIGE